MIKILNRIFFLIGKEEVNLEITAAPLSKIIFFLEIQFTKETSHFESSSTQR